MAVGSNGNLAWRVRQDMAFFQWLILNVKDMKKINAIILGQEAWEGIPAKYRPLYGCINIILAHSADYLKGKVPKNVKVVVTLDKALTYIHNRGDIESTWVITGNSLHKASFTIPHGGIVCMQKMSKVANSTVYIPFFTQFPQVEKAIPPKNEEKNNMIQYYFRVYDTLCGYN